MDYFSTTNPSSSGSTSVPNKGKEKKKCGKRGNSGVKLSTDPQSVAARERRHRISDRFKILQSLVPGGSKMDTVSMLEEAINYVKFLKTQILLHQTIMDFMDDDPYLYLPAAGSFPSQQPSYLDANFAAGVQPATPLPFPDSFFQGDEEVQNHEPFDQN
ncbi:hypothetical protein P3X46_008775 [Hevea brasiliensis]|uniref:BHLH domain-containing protein n=1 Tax=Hevea brasiliensis TaxID=3981 RepID=A0ABQ9MJW8_HEVBR|nr:transcription factor bHLH140 [Hevea brasiliensis]KAJ9180547.1 hypothetical protein P3X46_008775 [Hevea brasiliensis]